MRTFDNTSVLDPLWSCRWCRNSSTRHRGFELLWIATYSVLILARAQAITAKLHIPSRCRCCLVLPRSWSCRFLRTLQGSHSTSRSSSSPLGWPKLSSSTASHIWRKPSLLMFGDDIDVTSRGGRRLKLMPPRQTKLAGVEREPPFWKINCL